RRSGGKLTSWNHPAGGTRMACIATESSTHRPKGENTLQPSDPAPGEATAGRAENGDNRGLSRTLVWIGVGVSVAGLGAAVAYSIVRAVVGARRLPDDPTGQRIQQLIDEANSLLKTLDDQRNSA
ncbi:MAG: hypothetical protein ABI231_10365, partial [Candidatus Tumulicola sp.]